MNSVISYAMVAIMTEQEMCHNVTNAPLKMSRSHFFPELGPEVKVTVIGKQYPTFRDPKMYMNPHTKFGIPTSNDI